MKHLYILGTIVLTVYAQLILKWQMSLLTAVPADLAGKALFYLQLVLRPWILTTVVAAFLAFLCWATALQHFELSYAYPYMGASFVLVLWLSFMLFHEPLTVPKVAGTLLIVAGIALGSRG